MHRRNLRSVAKSIALVVCLSAAGIFDGASAGTIVPCNGNCTWSIDANGAQVASGSFAVDPKTGDIQFTTPGKVSLGGGAWAQIQTLSGNTDPILGFSVKADTAAAGQTFSFNFSIPISLSGPLEASSSVSYSLTSLSSAGAQISPLNGHVVVAQEVDSSVGGLPPLDKGVDVGDTYFFTGGPTTVNSPVYTKSSALTGNSAYDLMSVTLGFALSSNSQAGVSGFVQQTPVPLPPALSLLLSAVALAAIAVIASPRYRRS
jgi:hypothetical protein